MKDFYKPRSLSEAIIKLDLAQKEKTTARLLAGGTDLIIALRERKLTADLLIDISDLEELKTIQIQDNELIIGAGVTFADLENNPLILEHLPMLATAAVTVGAPAIRSRATLGGNTANRAAAADSIPVLLAADALIDLESPRGRRTMPVEEFLTSQNNEALQSDEVLTAFRIPLHSGWTNSFEKIGKRKALAIARINLGMMLNLDPVGTIRDARVAVGCVGKVCYRVRNLEGLMRGRMLDEALREEASELIEEIVMTNLKGRKTTPYKKQIARAVLCRALTRIMEDVQQ